MRVPEEGVQVRRSVNTNVPGGLLSGGAQVFVAGTSDRAADVKDTRVGRIPVRYHVPVCGGLGSSTSEQQPGCEYETQQSCVISPFVLHDELFSDRRFGCCLACAALASESCPWTGVKWRLY